MGACLGPRNSITLIDGASAAMTNDIPERRESMRTKLGDDFAVAPLCSGCPSTYETLKICAEKSTIDQKAERRQRRESAGDLAVMSLT